MSICISGPNQLHFNIVIVLKSALANLSQHLSYQQCIVLFEFLYLLLHTIEWSRHANPLFVRVHIEASDSIFEAFRSFRRQIKSARYWLD